MRAEDERKKLEVKENMVKYAETLKFQTDIAARLKNNFG